MSTTRTWALARTALAATLISLPALSQDKLVLEVGRAETLHGPVIEDAVILIEGGKIQAVGKSGEVEVPWDAVVQRLPEHTAFPGFIEAHTSRGMDRPNETIEVAPFLNIRDSIDPVNSFFEDMLRAGVTTIGIQQGDDAVIAGQGMVVKPHGMTVEQMLVKPGSGLKMVAAPKRGKSRATQAQALRGAFRDLRAHLEQLVQEKRDGNDRARREALYQGRDLSGDRAMGRAMEGLGWKVDGLELVPRGEIEEKQEPLLDVVEGRLPVWFACDTPLDVHRALELSRDNGFLHTTSLVLEPACYKAADLIAEAGLHVVLTGMTYTERDPRTGETDEISVVEVFRDKGIPFALTSRNSSTQALWYQAAMAMSHGLTRDEALASVTSSPAKMLGLEGRVGKLAAGHDANVLICSGDPLSVTTTIDHVFIEGKHVYDRSKDGRVRQLLDGTQPENTMAEGLDGRVRAEASSDDEQDEDDQ